MLTNKMYYNNKSMMHRNNGLTRNIFIKEPDFNQSRYKKRELEMHREENNIRIPRLRVNVTLKNDTPGNDIWIRKRLQEIEMQCERI